MFGGGIGARVGAGRGGLPPFVASAATITSISTGIVGAGLYETKAKHIIRTQERKDRNVFSKFWGADLAERYWGRGGARYFLIVACFWGCILTKTIRSDLCSAYSNARNSPDRGTLSVGTS